MKIPGTRLLTATILGCALLLMGGCSKLQSRDEMNKGVMAYKNTHYPQAVQHFKEAVRLDPGNQNAQALSGNVLYEPVGAWCRFTG